MIAKKRIVAITSLAQQEGVLGNITGVLERAVTAADLIAILQQFDPETPVEVEIPVEIDDESGDMMSEVGFVIEAFESHGPNNDANVITLRACKPDMLEDYKLWSADDAN
jgi:hypothetical protein